MQMYACFPPRLHGTPLTVRCCSAPHVTPPIALSSPFPPTAEVSRVLRYYANDEDAAVECLVMGQSKSEEEVAQEVLRMARSQQSTRLRAAGGAAAVAPPAYSHAMLGIDEDEVGCRTEMTERTGGSSRSVAVGGAGGGGSSEDWSHLYAQQNTHSLNYDNADY